MKLFVILVSNVCVYWPVLRLEGGELGPQKVHLKHFKFYMVRNPPSTIRENTPKETSIKYQQLVLFK